MKAADIPLIDLTPARLGGAEGEQLVARQIDVACRGIGFFTVHGHGIDRSVFTEAYAALGAFFDLPAVDKVACRPARGATMPGDEYTPYGYSGLLEENAFAYMGVDGKPSDYVEKFSTGRLVLDQNGSLHFPDGALGQRLRKALQAYYQACQRFSARITELFTLSLGLPRDFFAQRIDRSKDSLRAHRYPRWSLQLANDQGMGEHTDGTLITLLSHTGPGLEVRNRAEQWITPLFRDVDHLIVNIGDLMAHWTENVYVSTAHRVVLTPEGRHSLVFFKLTNEDETVIKGNQQMDALFGRSISSGVSS